MPSTSGSPTQIATSAETKAELSGDPVDQFKSGDLGWVQSELVQPHGPLYALVKPGGGPPVNGTTVLAVFEQPTMRWVSLSLFYGGGAGGAGPMLFNVYVSKNGADATADGSDEKPFLTVQAAMEYAWTTYVAPLGPQPVPPFTRPCVFVQAGTYDDGPLVLPPQICVMGEGYNHSRIRGDWSIDVRWSNYVPPSLPSPPSVLVPNDFRSSWINVGLFGTIDIDFDPVFSNEGKLYAVNTRFAGNVTFAEKRPNPVSNSLLFIGCEFLGDMTLRGIPTLWVGCVSSGGGTLTLEQLIGTGVDNLFETAGGSFGNLVVSSTSALAPVYTCVFTHGVQAGATLTLDGPFSLLKSDTDALPLQSLVSLLGGANINQIARLNQPNFSGITADRPPLPYVGQQYFDTTIGFPVWWDGAMWITAGAWVPA